MSYFYIYIIPLITSLFISIIIIKFWGSFFSFGEDRYDEIQKIHNKKAYRLGGPVVLISLIFSYFIIDIELSILLILFCMLPLIAAGFAEDLFGNINIKTRLISIIASVIMIVLFYNTVLREIDSPLLNYFYSIRGMPILFTILGITATSIAWNFIDGLNGFSSGLGFIILFCLSTIAFSNNLIELFYFLTIISFSILGFWFVNITTGKIFLGDLGSMTIGLIVGWAGVEIVNKSQNYSPWVIFLLIIYPATDITFSIARRAIGKRNPLRADDLHLHTIFYKFMSKKLNYYEKNKVNSLSGILITVFASIPAFIVMYFPINYPNAIFVAMIFSLIYILLYFYLLKFLQRNN